MWKIIVGGPNGQDCIGEHENIYETIFEVLELEKTGGKNNVFKFPYKWNSDKQMWTGENGKCFIKIINESKLEKFRFGLNNLFDEAEKDGLTYIEMMEVANGLEKRYV